jgi:SSS family solute:Na+ symporter
LASSGYAVANADGIFEIPFLDRMGIVFLICLVGMYFISMNDIRKGIQTNGLEVDSSMFKLHPAFVVGVLILFGIIAALYTLFW